MHGVFVGLTSTHWCPIPMMSTLRLSLHGSDNFTGVLLADVVFGGGFG
jgi:hypothetical protein